MIELLQHSFPQVPMNLALEEVLLAPFSHREAPPLLRIWNNSEPCIILGRSEKPDQQVDQLKAGILNIPIYRRTSGGGTVLHGPGNINISFFLPYSFHPELKSIKRSYGLILSWVCESLEKSCGIKPDIQGDSDLAIHGKKISGTAQARKRFGLLHHMTLLLDDRLLTLLDSLQEPQRRPTYRGNRTHQQFVTSLQAHGCPVFPMDFFVQQLCKPFGGSHPHSLIEQELQAVSLLALGKYSQAHWNMMGKETHQI